MASVFSLNLHATWACRHSGACCTAGWAIPVEPQRRALLGGEVLLPDARGACGFFDREASLCRVHRDHGELALPDTCYQFPRRALVDDRGTFVSLSHFCPTAAALIVRSAEPPAIVESPAAFPEGRVYEGLDGRDAWPPLVKADLLFDLASYTGWEQFVVASLGRVDASAQATLVRLADAVEHLRGWTPAAGPLEARVAALLNRPPNGSSAASWPMYQPFTGPHAYERIVACVPDGFVRPDVPDNEPVAVAHESQDWRRYDAVARRYLAAKAFGSWSAYEARGIRTLVAELTASEFVLRVEAARATAKHERPLDDEMMIEAVRAADWLLIHLVDRPQLMAWLGTVETY